MKILVISNMYPSAKDKVYGTFVKVFYDGLIDNGEKASLIAIKGKSNNSIKKLFKYLSFYLKVFFTLLLKKYDVIYVHTISHTIPPILLASKVRKFNLMFNIHGDDLLTTSQLALKLRNLAIPLLKRASMIVVPTNYFKEILISEFRWIDNSKIEISPSGGLDKKFYINNEHTKNEIPVFGYVSRIDEGKGWDILLDAIKEVIDLEYNLKLIMVGSGKQVSQLMQKINNLNLSEFVFYIGALTHDELPRFYSSLDWFIFPTHREGESLGLVGLEAMAACTPVIGSNMAGLQSYIADGNNGYFFEPKNSKDLASKIIKAINLSPSEKEVLKHNAYNTAIPYEATRVNNLLLKKIAKRIQ